MESLTQSHIQPDDAVIPPRRKLRSKAAADYIGLASSTLAKLRMRGDGPLYSKAGRIVIYDVADLEAWLSHHKRSSTSDLGETH